MMSTVGLFSLWKLLMLVIAVHGDSLTVNTDRGQVRGESLRTLVQKKEYVAYKGIPFAEPPIGNLRFRAPQPIKQPWKGILEANKFGNACQSISKAELFPNNYVQSEDCLHLNVYTPVTSSNKINAKKAVMFFIHGGAFTDEWYGPDFIVDDDVILVTSNYRLGPWGFVSFGIKGYTGNMGFKDQQMALEWTHRNIENFGGDPNQITVFGESVGGVSVHLQMLSEKSRKLMKRAIPMSGSTFTRFGHNEVNDHVDMLKKAYGLGATATGHDVLKFMLEAPLELIRNKTPSFNVHPLELSDVPFMTVVEDVEKAENPFLTQRPQEIYKTTKINVPAMFGVTSAENMITLDPSNAFTWLELLKNQSNIELPFSGLTISAESPIYLHAVGEVYKFYFGDRTLEPTQEMLEIYFQMTTDTNFAYPVYEALKFHSAGAETYCYEMDLDLKMNIIKRLRNATHLKGMAHMEDLPYIFRSTMFPDDYAAIMANLNDPINQRTMAALKFVPKMFTDYAKTGRPSNFGSFSGLKGCVGITNDGLKPLSGFRPIAMQFWESIHKIVEPWITNPF